MEVLRPLLTILALTAACSATPSRLSNTEPVDPPSATSDAPQSFATATTAPSASAVAATSSSALPSEPPPFFDTLGGLESGASGDVLVARFGNPKSKSPIEEEAATGEFVSTWQWADGLTVTMSGSSKKGALQARAMRVEAPSKLETSKGIRVGSRREEVEAAYGKNIMTATSNDGMIVVGEMLGGMRIYVDGQRRVTAISYPSDGE